MNMNSPFFSMPLIVVYLVRYVYWIMFANSEKSTGCITHHQADIHFIRYGSGEPIVLLHGGLSNRFSWFSQIPFLVNTGRQVIVIDTRGHGKSTLGYKKVSYRLYAEDVLKVLDYLALERADLVGWSDGGITALMLARYSPTRVKRVIAISANICPTGLVAESSLPLTTHSFWLWLQSRWTGAGDHFRQLDKAVKELWSSPILPESELAMIEASTMIIVGENDVVTVTHSQLMASLVRDAKLVVIKGGGHATPVTHATQINQHIEHFLMLN